MSASRRYFVAAQKNGERPSNGTRIYVDEDGRCQARHGDEPSDWHLYESDDGPPGTLTITRGAIRCPASLTAEETADMNQRCGR